MSFCHVTPFRDKPRTCRNGETGGGGWVYPQGDNDKNMTLSWLGYKKKLVSTVRAIFVLLGLRKKQFHPVKPPFPAFKAVFL